MLKNKMEIITNALKVNKNVTIENEESKWNHVPAHLIGVYKPNGRGFRLYDEDGDLFGVYQGLKKCNGPETTKYIQIA